MVTDKAKIPGDQGGTLGVVLRNRLLKSSLQASQGFPEFLARRQGQAFV